VTDNLSLYWKTSHDYTALLDNFTLTDMGPRLQERVAQVYQWDVITDQYEELLKKMVTK
jgi:glycosyltransferase involved in cell wall biosynthesis